MKRLLVLIALAMILTGCDEDGFGEDAPIVYPDMTIQRSDNMHMFNYVIDARTDVVYIIRSVYGSNGMTVAYNADGTIMKREDYEKLVKQFDEENK